MKRFSVYLLAVLGFWFAVLFGRWAQSLFVTSEMVHFSVNFPMNKEAQMSRDQLGGPWSRIAEEQWSCCPVGGVLTWGTEGKVVVDVGKQGWLKQKLQPNYVSISTHWIRNVGQQPYQIRLDMDLCGMELEWETFEANWDQAIQTSTRFIQPGDVFNMDWYFHIPAEYRNRSTICDGKLTVFDAQTQDLLTELPISIVNSSVQ